MRSILFFSVVLVFVLLIAAFAGGQTVAQPQPPTGPPPTLPAAPIPASPAANNPTPTEEKEWSNVQQLDHDQPIHIFASGSRRETCLFTGATGAMLFCEPEYASRSGLEYRFSRADVQTIRLDQFHRNLRLAVIIPAIAGATAGVILGATGSSDKTCPPVFCEVVIGVAGAGAGALAGAVVALPIAMLIPGKRIYHRVRRINRLTAMP